MPSALSLPVRRHLRSVVSSRPRYSAAPSIQRQPFGGLGLGPFLYTWLLLLGGGRCGRRIVQFRRRFGREEDQEGDTEGLHEGVGVFHVGGLLPACGELFCEAGSTAAGFSEAVVSVGGASTWVFHDPSEDLCTSERVSTAQWFPRGAER